MKKRPIPKLLPLIVLFLIGGLFESCSNKEEKNINVNPAFSEYVKGYTSGVIHKDDVISIQLAQPIGTERELYTPIENDYLSFKPAIDGELYWSDQQTLSFKPSESLKSNQIYSATFELGELISVPKEFESFNFMVRVIKQDVSVNSFRFSNYSSEDYDLKQFSAQIVSSDLISEQELNSILTAEIDGEKQTVKWLNTGGKISNFQIDSIQRKLERSELILHWDLEDYGSKSTSDTFQLLGLNEFGVVQTELIKGDESYLKISFSDPLLEQDFEGLVVLEDVAESNLKFKQKENVVEVYIQEKIGGDRQLTVFQGIKNSKGISMKDTYTESIVFAQVGPQIRLNSKGVYLPESNGLIYSFSTVNLNAVDVFITQIFNNNVHQYFQDNDYEGTYNLTRVGRPIATKHIDLTQNGALNMNKWTVHAIDIAELIDIEPGAIYELDFRMKPDYSTYICNSIDGEEVEKEELEIPEFEHAGEWGDYYVQDHYYDFVRYNWRERDNPCFSSYYYNYDRRVKAKVIASNIGLIAKTGGDRKIDITTTDLITGKPLSGAEVKVYDYQNQLLTSGASDGEGFYSIEIDRKPFLAVAEHNNQKTYLKLADGLALSNSQFEVGGNTVKKGLKGFIYGERGVWRPGDTLHITFVLEDKEHILPKNFPVVAELKDPTYKLIERQVETQHVNNVYYFPLVTDVNGKTGIYSLDIKVGNRNFSKSLPVETIKPNRLKIELDVSDDIIKGYEEQYINLHAEWLHGAKLSGENAAVKVRYTPKYRPFKKLKNYTFNNNVLASFEASSSTLFEGDLSSTGDAEIKLEPWSGQRAPGILNASFDINVDEPGGGMSENHFTKPYSPYQEYVGISVPKGTMWGNALTVDEDHMINFVLVNEEGNKQNDGTLDIRLYKIDWSWWWHRSYNSIGNYIASNSHALVLETEVDIKNGIGSYTLNMPKEKWGQYILIAENGSNGHQSVSRIYFDWPYWMRANRTEGTEATMLGFSSDKEMYEVGEEVKITFPSSENSKALVAVENGTKILKKFWVDTEKGETKTSFTVTEEMLPNVFINIMAIQPHDQSVNDRPIRQYGYIPIKVEYANSHLHPEIITTDVFRPESECVIKVKEQDGRKMTYTLAVVDEGLLGITSFKTPDPHAYFNQFEALGVKTWDMMDLVIGAYGGSLESILSIGGDGESNDPEKAKANRFKSVIKYFGPFELDANATAEHKFEMPNYVGEVRAFVVAVDHGVAYGNTEKSIPVRSPVMVQGTLPRILQPGTEIQLPVTVFAMEDHVKEVKVTLESNEFLKIKGDPIQSVEFSEIGDKMVYFKAEILNKEGIANIAIKAQSGQEKASYKADILVYSSNPMIEYSNFVKLDPGESLDSSLLWSGIENSGKGAIEVSSMPSLNLDNRLGYLIRYPYGCLEQTVSGAFPQLYLDELTPLTGQQKADLNNNIAAALNKLVNFQTTSGRFSYWPGYYSYHNVWADLYAGMFIVEADRLGYTMPVGLKERWISATSEDARNEYHESEHYSLPRESNQQLALRLWVLAKANEPQIGAMNRLKERGVSGLSKVMLAAAYAEIGQKQTALDMVKNIAPITDDYPLYTSYNFGSYMRDNSIMAECLYIAGNKDAAFEISLNLAERLSSSSYYSTQATACALRTMAQIYPSVQNNEGINVDYTLNGKSTHHQSANTMMRKEFKENVNRVSVVNNGKDPIFVLVSQALKPALGSETNLNKNLDITVSFTNNDGASIDYNDLIQGTEFLMKVTVENPTQYYFNDLALNIPVPAGWEILESRLYAGEATQDYYQYKDVRDDRVDYFFSLYRGQSKTFVVRLSAAYLGKFYLPATKAESMYTDKIKAYKKGSWVTVYE